MELIIIAAMTKEYVIGRDHQLPWHIPEELQLFKRLTKDHILIMGRNTFQSIGRILPDRTIIVVSKTMCSMEKVIICQSLSVAFHQANILAMKSQQKIFIIGGANIFTQALHYADTLMLSIIKKNYNGDIFFPQFDHNLWELKHEEEHSKFLFRIYTKIKK